MKYDILEKTITRVIGGYNGLTLGFDDGVYIIIKAVAHVGLDSEGKLTVNPEIEVTTDKIELKASEETKTMSTRREALEQAEEDYKKVLDQAREAREKILAQNDPETVAPAWKAFSEVMGPAREALDKAMSQAGKAYSPDDGSFAMSSGFLEDDETEKKNPIPLLFEVKLMSTRKEALEQAWKVYKEAMAQAWEAFEELMAQVLKAYDETEMNEEFRAQKWEAYQKSMVQAEEAYIEAKGQAEKLPE